MLASKKKKKGAGPSEAAEKEMMSKSSKAKK